MTTAATSAPGMCKLIGCPGWGRHGAHSASVKIGAGSWDDYTKATHCLGTIEVQHLEGAFLVAACALSGRWLKQVPSPMRPDVMAQLVDTHKRECPNRSPR